MAGSMEMKASVMGVRIGAAASYAASTMSSSQSVYVLAQASKLGSAPLALPSRVPPLSQEAVNILKSGATGAKLFGAHLFCCAPVSSPCRRPACGGTRSCSLRWLPCLLPAPAASCLSIRLLAATPTL